MTTYNDSLANIASLAHHVGMPSIVADAWLRCEGQAVPNPTNPLNIRFYGTPGQLHGPGATGAPGVGFARYVSADVGLADAARVIHTLSYYAGVRRALATGNALTIARAIEDSPWAAGHYGGAGSADGCIARFVKAHPAPAPSSSGHGARPARAVGFMDAIGARLYSVTAGVAKDLGIDGNVHAWIGPAAHYPPNATLSRILTGGHAGAYVRPGAGPVSPS